MRAAHLAKLLLSNGVCVADELLDHIVADVHTRLPTTEELADTIRNRFVALTKSQITKSHANKDDLFVHTADLLATVLATTIQRLAH